MALFSAASLLALGNASAPRSSTPIRGVTWDEARPVVERLIDGAPGDLRAVPSSERAAAWPAWVERRRAAIAARVRRGDEDSVTNLLLFGTSFTNQPRVTAAFLESIEQEWQRGAPDAAEHRLASAYRQRAADLVSAMVAPAADDRLRFARTVVERAGYRLDSVASRQAAQEFLLRNLVRMREEAATLTRALDQARQAPDSTSAFAERSRVFRARGLAPDSSVLTQYAVDSALAALKTRGVLPPGGVRRVAVVGPGLDFVDKQEGLDLFPPQSLQPLTVIDSLLRLGLSAPRVLDIVALDVNPRVTGHLSDARQRAESGSTYRLVFPRFTTVEWLPGAVAYWDIMGSEIGAPFEVTGTGGLPGLVTRGVAVRPDIVSRVAALDANVVYDRLDVPAVERFDLVVATNVFLYYDTFEQTLALAGVAAMLRPGGLLLTNNALLEIPEVPMKSRGYVTVRFSERDDDGEHVVWYERGG